LARNIGVRHVPRNNQPQGRREALTKHIRSRATESRREEHQVNRMAKLPSRLIYEVIRRDGEEELHRPMTALMWSGLAAGLLISASVLGEAILVAHLPDIGASFLIENLGYSLGFLLVIIGRMQLFTENTITTVLPLAADPRLAMFGKVARLWAAVLAANVVGAVCAAVFLTQSGILDDAVYTAVVAISEHATRYGATEGFLKSIPAGVLIAAIVWMMPSAEDAKFAVIVTFTWLIAAGDFLHIVAGTVEAATMVLVGGLSFADAIGRFFLPVLAGNIVGGTLVFTLLAWAQVKEEVEK
jgi:formate/nitrite transporter FocA (FNT family)